MCVPDPGSCETFTCSCPGCYIGSFCEFCKYTVLSDLVYQTLKETGPISLLVNLFLASTSYSFTTFFTWLALLKTNDYLSGHNFLKQRFFKDWIRTLKCLDLTKSLEITWQADLRFAAYCATALWNRYMVLHVCFKEVDLILQPYSHIPCRKIINVEAPWASLSDEYEHYMYIRCHYYY